ncbi:MAG TPA: hypothetical protein VE869_02275 [Gemmatimonas sp.]|nr:hypothetical protein [Gemmatimonas sp.]
MEAAVLSERTRPHTRSRGARLLVGFAAGAASVLTVHQGLLFVLNAAGAAPWPAYSMAPTRPWGVPEVVSAAFWGGVWGAVLGGPMLRTPSRGRWFWGRAMLLGAVAPTAVGALFLLAGAGKRFSDVSYGVALVSALIVNGAWGAATASAVRALRVR